MNPRQCTANLLTPLAPGGVAVIRLAGDGAVELARRVCRRRGGATPAFEPGRLHLCRLMDGNEVLDDVVAVATAARGADDPTVEICLHGGVRVVQRAMLLLERRGARRVESPVFSGVDADAGSGDQRGLTPEFLDAAVERTLPLATTRVMAAWLLGQRSVLNRLAARLSGRAPDSAASSSTAGPPVAPDEWSAALARGRIAARALAGLRIALVGPPNVGKSTLANALIGRERVITSDQPGTTRDWVEETALIAGWPVTLTDTAGVRTTSDPLEQAAIEHGQSRAAGADLLVTVADAREVMQAGAVEPQVLSEPRAQASRGGRAPQAQPFHGAQPPPAVSSQRQPPSAAQQRGAAVLQVAQPPPAESVRLIVANKADLLAAGESNRLPPDAIAVSALHRRGLDALERALAVALGLDQLIPNQPALFMIDSTS